MRDKPVVYILEDDVHVRKVMVFILQRANFATLDFGSPQELLEKVDVSQSGCVLVDFHLPQMNGLELCIQLRRLGSIQPFILVSGRTSISATVQAMRMGAIDVLEKPFRHDRIIESVRRAIDNDADRRRTLREFLSIEDRLNQLTEREKQVLHMVVGGMLTKQIARELEISTKTVEVHRSNLTKKMGTTSIVQLARIWTQHSLHRTSLQESPAAASAFVPQPYFHSNFSTT